MSLLSYYNAYYLKGENRKIGKNVSSRLEKMSSENASSIIELNSKYYLVNPYYINRKNKF